MRTSRRLLNALMTPALLASASYALAQDKSAKAAPDQWTPQGQDLVTVPAIPKTYKPAKTPWGEPDFRGGWPVDHLNMTPLQRTPAQGTRYFLNDDEFAARQKQIGATATRYDTEQKNNKLGMGAWMEPGKANRMTSMIVDPPNGRVPDLTDEGKRRSKLMKSDDLPGQTFDWVDDFDSWDRCITRGMPASMFTINYNNGIRVWQSPGIVAIQLEMVHETRIIPTDGRPSVARSIHNWIGESRGHWENGNTLVVVTTNFQPGPSATNVGTYGSPPGNITPVSTEAVMTERFTMTGHDAITYEMTWNDPTVFTKPWTTRLPWRRNDNYQMFEYACHEGNVQVRNFITASRAKRAQEAAQKAKAQ
jgi:hypothetical protein